MCCCLLERRGGVEGGDRICLWLAVGFFSFLCGTNNRTLCRWSPPFKRAWLLDEAQDLYHALAEWAMTKQYIIRYHGHSPLLYSLAKHTHSRHTDSHSTSRGPGAGTFNPLRDHTVRPNQHERRWRHPRNAAAPGTNIGRWFFLILTHTRFRRL